MSDTQLLLYDKNYYDLAKTDGFDKDITDYADNGRVYAANRGVMTNNLEYGESLNPVYGTIMDLISGKAVLPKGALGNVPTNPRPQKQESNYISNMNTNSKYATIGESMLTIGDTPSTKRGMAPAPVVPPRPVRPPVRPGGRPFHPTKRNPIIIPVVVAPHGAGAMGGGGGGGGGEPEKKDEAGAEGTEKTADASGDTSAKPNYLAMGIGALVGGIAGYMYAAKNGKSAIGFGLGGAVVGAGAGWAVGKYMLKPKATEPAAAPATEEKKFCGCGA
jgi:hypothetical protein